MRCLAVATFGLFLPFSCPGQQPLYFQRGLPLASTHNESALLLRMMEAPMQRFLAAYNAGELPKMKAELWKDSPGLPDASAVQRLFTDYYFAEFGKLQRYSLVPAETTLHRDRGSLTYIAIFEKAPRAVLSANFIRESGDLKIAQIRFEKF